MEEEKTKAIIKNIEELPLCTDGEFGEPEDIGSFLEGQAHMKRHIIENIKNYLQPDN